MSPGGTRCLLPDQDKDSGDQGEDREQKACAHSGNADNANHNEVNREQKHADVFREVHAADDERSVVGMHA